MGTGGVHSISKDGVDRPCIFIVIKVTAGIGSPPLKLLLDIDGHRVVWFYSDVILWSSVFYLDSDN